LDTQISTRFAKEIACDYADVNCDGYDFFYTLESDAPIIGGPSAGAAISVLTAAVLKGYDIKEDVAITGTINSGGLIGPVSGLRQKIEISPDVGINIVLIPSGQSVIKEMNLSWDLIEYAEPLGVDVIEATDMDEAVSIFTGIEVEKEKKEIIISKDYQKVMEDLAFKLCNRTKMLREETNDLISDKETEELGEKAINLTKKSETSVSLNEFYSAASYCFSANVKYRTIIVYSARKIDFNSTKELIEEMSGNLEKIPVKTITDLESFMVVKDRLKDAEDNLEEAEELYNEDDDYWINIYAYTVERIFSAESWAEFFGKPGKEFLFDDEVLKKSCVDKIGEAEERYSYVDLLIPGGLSEIKKIINYAYDYMHEEDYEVCLYEASKAKSEADAIISLIGVDEDYLDNLVNNKLGAVKGIIAKQIDKGNFPIVGYSYYEYANSLKENDKSSALLYAEYALELSNLDLYFKERHKKANIKEFKLDCVSLIIGILIGLAAAIVVIKTLANPRRSLRGKKR
jgi:uncharacterized protein